MMDNFRRFIGQLAIDVLIVEVALVAIGIMAKAVIVIWAWSLT